MDSLNRCDSLRMWLAEDATVRDRLLRTAVMIQPAAGELFWQRDRALPRLYLLLEGRVRLLDETDNLVTSLEPGDTFGECTLIETDVFQPYQIRASVGTRCAAIELEHLLEQWQKSVNPTGITQLETQLQTEAILKDLLLLSTTTLPMPNTTLSQWRQGLAELETIETIKESRERSVNLVDYQFCLLRRGELQSINRTFTAGDLIIPSHGESDLTQIVTPVECYGLKPEHWQNACRALPRLIEFIESQGNTTPSRVFSLSPTVPAPISASAIAFPPSSADLPLPSLSATPHTLFFPKPTTRLTHWWQRLTHRYPWIAQQSAMDCGITCLAMIGQYWGKNFSINHLRRLANVDRRGATLKGLMSAAEQLGFAPRPVKATLAKLAQQPLPAIAHWDGKHYVVVYEVQRDRVRIADPEVGPRLLSGAEFEQHWTGYALLLEPTRSLNEAAEAKQTLWKFLALVQPHRRVLVEVLAASIVLQLLGLLMPLFTQMLLDQVVVQRSESTLIAIGAGLIIFGVFRIIITSLRQYLLYHTANRLDLSLVVGFIHHTLRLPLSYFEARYVGDITSRVQENMKIRQFLTSDALTTVLDLFTVFIYVGLMLWYSWQMAVLGLVVLPVFIGLAVITTPFLQKVSREIFSARTSEESYLIEILTGISTIKSMGLERSVRWRWENLFAHYIRKNFSGQLIRERLRFASNLAEMVSAQCLLVFGVWQVIHQHLTIGQLIAFNMLMGNVIRPFQRLIDLWDDFQEVTIAVERINDVIDTAPEEATSPTRMILPMMEGHIRFEQVSFAYNPDQENPTLDRLSFTVQPGQTIAIVGRSGSGKTTISKLLLGLYQPTAGKIFIDGHDLSTLSRRSLRQQVGVVDQDTFLFGGTIRENLLLANPEATPSEIQQAAHLAGAEGFINDLPMKYDTQIGEGGGMLSGGQRQRLAIARALLGNPRLLILDEATSSLDAESEQIIQQNLGTILNRQTTVVIAHRLSTIRKADRILVLDRGHLVESGTHDELMHQQGHYFYLNQQQLAAAG